jgi:transmembrane sensor
VVTPAEHRSEATAQVGNTRSRRVGRRPALIAAAATILLVVGVGAYLALVPGGDRYVTPVGGLASVPISDGSKVTLNTDSEIRVAMTHTERRVDLDQGEAFFEVAHDPTRPFIVHAGNKRVIAVGTKFAVRRQGDDVRIVVTEGKVKLEADALAASPRGSAVPTDPATGDPGSSSGSTRNAESATLLTAGTIARARDAGVLIQQRPLPEVEDYLSWRSGFLTFRETSLGDAVAEFNRYNERQIVIDDPQIAAIRLSGKFRSTQFEAFVRLIEDGLPIRARYTDGRIVLTDARAAQ